MSVDVGGCGWVVSVATSILLSDEDDSVADSHNVFCEGAIKRRVLRVTLYRARESKRVVAGDEFPVEGGGGGCPCRNYSSAVDKINGRNLGGRVFRRGPEAGRVNVIDGARANGSTSRARVRGFREIRSIRDCVRSIHFRGRERGVRGASVLVFCTSRVIKITAYKSFANVRRAGNYAARTFHRGLSHYDNILTRVT